MRCFRWHISIYINKIKLHRPRHCKNKRQQLFFVHLWRISLEDFARAPRNHDGIFTFGVSTANHIRVWSPKIWPTVRNSWETFGQAQSRTQSPRAFWPSGERPERLWDNRLHFPRKRGFRSYYVGLSLNGSRKEKTVNSRNGGLKVFEKQEF